MLWTNRALAFDHKSRWREAQSTGIDITERRQAEEHRRLLLDELNHRVKNTLMTVQAIANLSLSGSHSPEQLRESFTARLLALSRVHNLLTEENWMGASLRTVLSQALQPYGFSSDVKGRIGASGPHVPLSSKEAQTFAMAFHELATNAAKYGALSNASGRVEILWAYEAASPSPFKLTWTESGGPAVARPGRKGFGSLMITEILASEIAGVVALDYAETGLICTMSGSVAG
jgi:two-component sensor histidine kinase